MVKFKRKAFSSAKIGSRMLGRLLKPILGSSKLIASIVSSIEPFAFSILGRLLDVVEDALRFFLILGKEGLARINLPAPSLWTKISTRRAEAWVEEEAYLVPEAQIVNIPMIFDLKTTREAMVGNATRAVARLSVPKPFLPVVSEDIESVFTELKEVSKIIIAPEIGEIATAFQGYVRHAILPYPIIPSPSFLGVVSGAEGRGKKEVEPIVDVSVGAGAGTMAEAGGVGGRAGVEVKVEVEVEGERISPYLPLGEAMHVARVFKEAQKEALAYAYMSLPKASLPVFSQTQLMLWLQSQLQLQPQPQPQPSLPILAEASLSPTFSYRLPYSYVLPRALWSPLMEVPKKIAPIAALPCLPIGSISSMGIQEGLGIALEPLILILSMEELPLATFLTTPLVGLLSTPPYPYATRVIAEAERIPTSLSAGESVGGLLPWQFSENLSLISRFAEETQRSLVLRSYGLHRLLGVLYSYFPSPPLPSSLTLSRSFALPLSYLLAATIPSPSHPLAFPATATIFRLGQELLVAFGEAFGWVPLPAILSPSLSRFGASLSPALMAAQKIELPTSVSSAMPSFTSWMRGPWDRFYLPNLEVLPQALKLHGALSRAMATMPVSSIQLLPFSVPWLRMGSQLSDIASLALSFVPSEAQALSLSYEYNEVFAELGISPIIREPVVVRIPPVSLGLSRAFEPLARLPEGEYQKPTQALPIPMSPISRLPPPVIQNTIHLTVPTDSEEDLRDLERKIARLLAEQIRRYYGNLRI
ncbi:hypothetical protein KEJ19_08505 [Candidatus Bathyarchaeota archaeon]|nr:hypothetical protein [Candidatus Bathyarchaeota archaeon]